MRKDKGFDTLECYTGLKHADVSGYHTVLLECMSNLTANEMYQEKGAGITVWRRFLQESAM